MMNNPYKPFGATILNYSYDEFVEKWFEPINKMKPPLLISHTFFITDEVLYGKPPLITQELVDYHKNMKILGRGLYK